MGKVSDCKASFDWPLFPGHLQTQPLIDFYQNIRARSGFNIIFIYEWSCTTVSNTDVLDKGKTEYS